jgi:hypothetical protein
MREFETEMRVREIEQTINEATHRSAQLALRAMRRRAAADELCGRTTAAVHCGARPIDCGMCGGAVGARMAINPAGVGVDRQERLHDPAEPRLCQGDAHEGDHRQVRARLTTSAPELALARQDNAQHDRCDAVGLVQC